jgi:DNA-directed RNA polymerase specialized sigma24 family protein
MKPPKTPFEEELEKNPGLLDELLVRALRRTGNAADAEDVRAITLYRAFRKEREGQGWPRDKVPLMVHLLVIMDGVLTERRRRWRRKPTAPIEDAPEQHDEAPRADHAYITMEEKCRASAKLREKLADDSQGAMPIAILDGWGQGIEGHSELADRIKCTVPEIRAAIKRLQRCAEDLAESWS